MMWLLAIFRLGEGPYQLLSQLFQLTGVSMRCPYTLRNASVAMRWAMADDCGKNRIVQKNKRRVPMGAPSLAPSEAPTGSTPSQLVWPRSIGFKPLARK